MEVSGAGLIKHYVKTLSSSPGVYRMVSKEGDVLYVGKAKSLRSRVISYTRPQGLPLRLQRMVHRTYSMEFVLTSTEWEALLLEATLIKKFQPPYNVLLKDDKAYPYLVVTQEGDLPPRLVIYRGAIQKNGRYFGPFASIAAVHQTFELLVRTFGLRTCQDTVYRYRKRPCLEYDLHRCTAPCVGKISSDAYLKNVEEVFDFLEGRTRNIQKVLKDQMLKASHRKDFEQAAVLRDQMRALEKIQQEQGVRLDNIQNTDAVAIFKDKGVSAIQVFFFRHGWNYGNHSFFPSHDPEESETVILETFLAQFYLNKPLPDEILINIPVGPLLHQAFKEKAHRSISMIMPQRGDKKRLISMAFYNAKEALARKIAILDSQSHLLERVQKIFGLNSPPHRIEIYDNSHIQGVAPYGAMVVATPEGFDKKAYRTFSIKNPKQQALAYGGDDYAMMEETLKRRLAHTDLPLPDLILLDGGSAHLAIGKRVLQALGLSIPLVAIAKGVNRNAGREVFHQEGKEPFQLPSTDPVLYYLQRLRDEAHRFAIGTHRKGRTSKGLRSLLENVEGIGPKRRSALLQKFTTLEEIKNASLEDLMQVAGFNKKIAKNLLDFFKEKPSDSP